jgi:hypothetical protein
MRNQLVRFLAFLAATATASAAPVEVYLIGGQSNATGQGYTKNLPPGFKINTDVRLYHSGAPHLRGVEPADTWHALAPASESPDRFGVELTLGNRLAELRPGKKIAIIKHAHSGTNLHTQWNPGADANDRAHWGPQFVTFVETVEAALKALRDRGDEPVIMGMVWHQGESDSGGGRGARAGADAKAGAPAANAPATPPPAPNTTNAENYGKNLTHFIARVREQFHAPDMPFVYAMITRPAAAGPGRDIVRQTLRDLDQNSGSPRAVRGAFVVQTDDLPRRKDDPGTPYPNDDEHVGTPGMLTEGTRMAEALNAHPPAGGRR